MLRALLSGDRELAQRSFNFFRREEGRDSRVVKRCVGEKDRHTDSFVELTYLMLRSNLRSQVDFGGSARRFWSDLCVSMDISRLPATLRRALLSVPQFQRRLSTVTYQPTVPAWTLAPKKQPGTLDSDALEDDGLLTLSSSSLNGYTISLPPERPQLRYANSFFASAPPQFLWSAAFFRSFPDSPHPEVAFLGRSNVGKSSLLNALFNQTKRPAAHVSKRPGRTRTMNAFGVTGPLLQMGASPRQGEHDAAWRRFPRGGAVVVDMPGYGSGSRHEWGEEALKYLAGRKQLRRTFILVDAEHGLKSSDLQLFEHLRKNGIPFQIILSKADKILYSGSKMPGREALSNRLGKLRGVCDKARTALNQTIGDSKDCVGDILCCSSEKSVEKNKHRKLGVDEVRWAVLAASGLESDESGQRRRADMADVNVLDTDYGFSNVSPFQAKAKG
nr:putative gtp-binding protein engb [Quercus suber]